MEFIDKLSAGLANTGRTFSQSAKNFADTTALKREINTEKRNIQQKYAEIGQLYYEKFNNDPGCDFFPEVDAILTSMRHIEALEEEIQEVQSRRPELVSVPEGTARTGSKPMAMVCMQCGQTFDTTQTFCANCGQKLIAQYAQPGAAVPPAAVTPAAPSDARVIPDQPPAPAASAEKRHCLNCGAEAAGDSIFCAQCGTKLV